MATVPPGNKQVGTVKAIAVSSLKLDGSDASIFVAESVVGFLVLREFQPRKEHVTMTIEYGAEAKLNQGDSQ